ncbi:LytR family transcriptional regulator [Bacillaceae bacterium CLA-AA-H227]|uniref:LytR family transcriptional regulator n=1 Tax=Robertmurraya yapensis (ex Hitch et al 2024) TaxID=3133160 RepID=A0ACC6SF31_9BACI
MKKFDTLPKTVKKTLRYILQDVNSLESLEILEKALISHIEKKKEDLKKH